MVRRAAEIPLPPLRAACLTPFPKRKKAWTPQGVNNNLCSVDTQGKRSGNAILAGNVEAPFVLTGNADNTILNIKMSSDSQDSLADFYANYCGLGAYFLGDYYRITIP